MRANPRQSIAIGLTLALAGATAASTPPAWTEVEVKPEALIGFARQFDSDTQGRFESILEKVLDQPARGRGGDVDEVVEILVCATMEVEGSPTPDELLATINENGWITGRASHLGETRIEYRISRRLRRPALERAHYPVTDSRSAEPLVFSSFIECGDEPTAEGEN